MACLQFSSSTLTGLCLTKLQECTANSSPAIKDHLVPIVSSLALPILGAIDFTVAVVLTCTIVPLIWLGSEPVANIARSIVLMVAMPFVFLAGIAGCNLLAHFTKKSAATEANPNMPSEIPTSKPETETQTTSVRSQPVTPVHTHVPNNPLVDSVCGQIIRQFTTDETSKMTVVTGSDSGVEITYDQVTMPVKEFFAKIKWSEFQIPSFTEEQVDAFLNQTALLHGVKDKYRSKYRGQGTWQSSQVMQELALAAYVRYDLFYAMNKLMRTGKVSNEDLNVCISLNVQKAAYGSKSAKTPCSAANVSELIFLTLILMGAANKIERSRPQRDTVSRNAIVKESVVKMLGSAQRTSAIVRNRCFLSTADKAKADFCPYPPKDPDGTEVMVDFQIQHLGNQHNGIYLKEDSYGERELLYRPLSAFKVIAISDPEQCFGVKSVKQKYTIQLQEVNEPQNGLEDHDFWVL